MRFSTVSVALTLVTTAFSLSCNSITNLTGVADTDSWIITSANATSANNVTYCEISAKIGRRIRTWFQLPTQSAWNGRYVQIGCGGACGYNPFLNTYFAIEDALQDGYALGTTDMGVPNSTANFGPMHNDFQMRIDWGYLATHLTAVMGKQLVKAYYGAEPEYSYHLGSSTGGRQSLVEGQTGVTTYSIIWTARAALLDEIEFTPTITNTEADLIHAAVLQACDVLDGLEDGAKQVPEGLLPGSEIAWQGTYIPSVSGSPSAWYSFSTSFLSNYAFWPDPVKALTPFSIDLSEPELLKKTSKTESLEYGGVADMTKFKQLGGKLIMTQGLTDVAVAPGFAHDLYERVGLAIGTERGEFMRFYQLPGVNHVSGGPGADTYDALGLLVDWVEEGSAPETIVAKHLDDDGNLEFTRPLFRFPMVAGYKGTGNVSDWESFEPVDGSAPFWDL